MKISIVVPVYNVENYLERCIESLRRQTYRNLEIILVDDGSLDKSGEICEKYAQLDHRLIVIHKKNGGLSDARNAGMEIASGDYVSFVDSDDWVSTFFIERMWRLLEKHHADIVECDYIRTDGSEQMNTSVKEGQYSIYQTEEALEHLIRDRVFHQVVWNKLYKKQVIEKIFFEVGKTNEDEYWTYQVFAKAKSVIKLNEKLHYYYQRPNSIMGEGYSLKRLHAIEAKVLRQEYIDKHFPALSNVAAENLIGTMIYAGQMSLLHLSGEEKKAAMKYLNSQKERIFAKKSYHFMSMPKRRIWNEMALLNLSVTCRIRNYMKINI